MKRRGVIAAGAVGVVGVGIWLVVAAGKREARRMESLAAESETVVLGCLVEVAEPGRDGTTQRVRYRVEEVFKGYRVQTFEVEFRLVDGPETDDDRGRRILSRRVFTGPGTRHLLFLRGARYGPSGGVATEDPSRAMEATSERIEALREILLQ